LALDSNGLRLILPSDGVLHESARELMRACNLAVERPSARRYTGLIPSLGSAAVLFQRAADVTAKVEEGNAELGITGLDRFLEYRREEGDALVLIDDLGFGQCDLVMAVPTAWLDVTTMGDLADVALEFRQGGRQIRIATKYPRLVRRHLLERGINYFNLVMASGTLEAAPSAGYADLIADLTASGETLRENGLRPLEEGLVLSSQACLIGNRKLIAQSKEMLHNVRALLEMMEGHLQGREFYRISANVRAESVESLAATLLEQPHLAGFQGPTVSKVYNVHGESWYAVSLVVARNSLLEVVDHLRGVGASEVSTSPVGYMFKGSSSAYQSLLSRL